MYVLSFHCLDTVVQIPVLVLSSLDWWIHLLKICMKVYDGMYRPHMDEEGTSGWASPTFPSLSIMLDLEEGFKREKTAVSEGKGARLP